MNTHQILSILEELDDKDSVAGNMYFDIPELEQNGLTDIDSDDSDDDSAGNPNHLGREILNTVTTFQPHNAIFSDYEESD